MPHSSSVARLQREARAAEILGSPEPCTQEGDLRGISPWAAQGPQLPSPRPLQSPETLGPQTPTCRQHRAPWACGKGWHRSVGASALGKLFKKPALSFY